MRDLVLILVLIFTTMRSFSQEIIIEEPLRFLALGDSYTIGESVSEDDRWPLQLLEGLKNKYRFEDGEVDIIATTGWTTSDLIEGVERFYIAGRNYNLVSLLIGVNNQYQGLDFSIYESEFRQLLERSIDIVGGDTNKVFVVSIPDYAYTPSHANISSISEEIDEYNQVNFDVSSEYGVLYFNITDISRKGLDIPSYVANDGLHPSGEQYAAWVEMMIPEIKVSLVNNSDYKLTNIAVEIVQTSGDFRINHPSREGLVSIADSAGKIIQRNIVSGNHTVFSKNQFDKGIHFVNYQDEEITYSKKIILF